MNPSKKPLEREREAGLVAAVNAAGGYNPLAKLLGLRPSTVFEWTRIPADRIMQVEIATGVSREVLRPDLYGPASPFHPKPKP